MKRLFKRLYLATKKLNPLCQQHSRHELLTYWQQPPDALNQPSEYAARTRRSEHLVAVVQRFLQPPAHILEVGCNVGRNLYYLQQASYQVSGIEISMAAIAAMKDCYPILAETATIYNLPVETAIRWLADRQFDLVFTMAVLEHIHPDSEWVFAEMVRIVRRWLITIEDEQTLSKRHFPRNYGTIFRALGLKQVEERWCEDWGFSSSGMKLRVFERSQYQ